MYTRATIQPQKHAKTEIGGLAKDWRSLAMSSAAPNGDRIQVTVPASGVRKDGLGGKKATIKACNSSSTKMMLMFCNGPGSQKDARNSLGEH